jgi:hypothetical protein
MPTALLICMENTFWNISRDNNFVELFKKSFTLYVDSGIRKKVEAAIDGLRNEQGGWKVTEDFNAKFFKVIIEHYLRKFHCSYLPVHSTHLTPKIQPTMRIKLLSWHTNRYDCTITLLPSALLLPLTRSLMCVYFVFCNNSVHIVFQLACDKPKLPVDANVT